MGIPKRHRSFHMYPGRPHLIPVCLALFLLSVIPAGAAKTAYRITDMDWRDPHILVSFLGCRDITDAPLAGFSMNGDLQSKLQGDADGDSLLDLSYLIIFDPLDQAGAGGTLAFGAVDCTAPMAGTSCAQSAPAPVAHAYNNMPASCLGILGGTVRPYTPAIVSSGPPCFVAYLGSVTIWVMDGVPMTLTDAYLAATYVGAPATTLANGLLRGFISETDANNTIIPASVAIFGGKALSFLFPGGDPPGPDQNCASYSDKDIGPGGVPGWYVYFNFSAVQVPYSETPTPVRDVAPMSLVLDVPHPNPFNPATTIRYRLPSASRVQLSVYDASGRLVTQLVNDEQVKGDHAVSWDGRDARGAVVGSGVYFVRLESRGEARTRKTILLK
jgi:hypothetical protein